MLQERNYMWITRTRGRRKAICFILVLLFCVAIFRKVFNYSFSSQSKLHDFMRDWCRLRKARVEWEQILKPCRDKLQWGSNVFDPGLQTDPHKSYISLWDIHPAGEFSRFSIQSSTAKGISKTIGGDSWRVNINGPSSVAGTLFDHSNGTYEIVFLVTVPGDYNVDIVLEHSLCDGYRDPPINWFITGSAQGKNQKEGTLGDVKHRPFLRKRLWGDSPIVINVPPPKNGESILSVVINKDNKFDLTCGLQCNHLWDGYGNWISHNNTLSWKPYVPHDDKKHDSESNEERIRKKSILWIYGDSVSEQFYSGVKQHLLCTKVFKWCGHTYNWVYRLQGNLTVAKTQDDDLDFDDVRVIDELDDITSHPFFDKESALLLNAGLHYIESSNFSSYQKVIDGMVRLFGQSVVQEKIMSDNMFPGQLIWKTTTSLHKEKLDSKHLQARRFLTSQRVLLFNAYATQAMCKAGHHVIDVFPLTDSYPYGTGKPERPKDAVHYQHFVFEAVERLLEDFLSR